MNALLRVRPPNFRITTCKGSLHVCTKVPPSQNLNINSSFTSRTTFPTKTWTTNTFPSTKKHLSHFSARFCSKTLHFSFSILISEKQPGFAHKPGQRILFLTVRTRAAGVPVSRLSERTTSENVALCHSPKLSCKLRDQSSADSLPSAKDFRALPAWVTGFFAGLLPVEFRLDLERTPRHTHPERPSH